MPVLSKGRCPAPSLLDRFAAAVTSPLVALLAMNWLQQMAWALVAAACCWTAALGARWLSGSAHRSATGDSGSALDRAPLFTEAWARRDQEQMLRFVLPGHEAKFHKWLSATPPAQAVAELQPPQRTIKVSSAESCDPEGVLLTLQVSCHPAEGKSWEFSQQQLWIPSAGVWCFAPETTPASAVAVPTPPPAAARGRVAVADDTDADPPFPPPRNSRAASGSRTVVVPTTVPPWQRTR